MRALLLMVLLALMACGAPQDDAVVELVYATPYSPNHPFSLADQQWMKFVHDRSGGTLRIKPNWSGALLSSEHSMVELRHGVADIGLITPIYVKGGAHLIRLQSGFYSGTTSFEQQVALYRCMAASSPQFAHELQGLKILAIQGGPLPGIVTTHKPLHSLDDIQGMRIRAPTELLNVLKRLGADPVNMPMGEVYSALAKGVLDGVIAPMDTFRSLHFAEVTHYYAGLIVPRGAYPARAMSEQRWSLLSPEHRAVLEEGIAVWEAALARQTEIALVAGEQAAEAAKIEFTALPAADQTRFDDLYLELARGNASSLSRYGIDGLAVFSVARASVQPDGTVSCRGGSH